MPSAVIRMRSQLLAERLGDAGDHADVADAVGVAEPLGRLDVLAWRAPATGRCSSGNTASIALEDLVRRARPGRDVQSPVGVEGHELDEAHADAPLAAEGGEVDDLVVVDAAHHDAVDLHRVEAGVERGVDPGEHPVEVVAAGERAEHVGAERVERHVDPPQAGGGEVVGHLRAASRRCVVMAMSTPRGASIATRRGRCARTVGSPPVIRTDSKPKRSTQTRTIRACSS